MTFRYAWAFLVRAFSILDLCFFFFCLLIALLRFVWNELVFFGCHPPPRVHWLVGDTTLPIVPHPILTKVWNIVKFVGGGEKSDVGSDSAAYLWLLQFFYCPMISAAWFIFLMMWLGRRIACNCSCSVIWIEKRRVSLLIIMIDFARFCWNFPSLLCLLRLNACAHVVVKVSAVAKLWWCVIE